MIFNKKQNVELTAEEKSEMFEAAKKAYTRVSLKTPSEELKLLKTMLDNAVSVSQQTTFHRFAQARLADDEWMISALASAGGKEDE